MTKAFQRIEVQSPTAFMSSRLTANGLSTVWRSSELHRQRWSLIGRLPANGGPPARRIDRPEADGPRPRKSPAVCQPEEHPRPCRTSGAKGCRFLPVRFYFFGKEAS